MKKMFYNKFNSFENKRVFRIENEQAHDIQESA